ncbi:MAG TPA: DNA alkylation repair protein [Mucilaginibacter sp.]|nr:DNA alkylation repair protein [Mucilaginibacter sp.]
MTVEETLTQLRLKSSPRYLDGMKRFGISDEYAMGIPLPDLRKLAKRIKTDHDLATALWKTKIHEARMLASMIADEKQLTEKQADEWVADFNSWDICDQVCGNILYKTPFAHQKSLEYAAAQEEFVKRAGFVLMAEFAIHKKSEADDFFLSFFPVMEREAWDNRNFVKKAISWSLRQIGKKNHPLMLAAIHTAHRIATQNHKAARWIASNALNELSSKTSLINN